MHRRTPVIVVVVGLALALSARTATAQSALAGVVRDASGGVLPGVTVEATSPALIEKVRTVITDDARAVSHRRSAARRLHGDLYLARVRHGDAREDRADRRTLRRRSMPRCGSARSKKPSRSPAPRRSSTCKRATQPAGDDQGAAGIGADGTQHLGGRLDAERRDAQRTRTSAAPPACSRPTWPRTAPTAATTPSRSTA